MVIQTKLYDPAEYLNDDESIEVYLQESRKIAVEIADPSFITQALGTVVRARWAKASLTPG
jgi:DNA-binding phage protein